MIDIILGTLVDAKPTVSSIVDCREVKHRDLSLIEVRYVQGNSYFAAKSYATASWIAPTPLGPKLSADGTLEINNINDIAQVDCYATAQDLKRRKWPSIEELAHVQDGMDLAATEFIMSKFPSLRDSLYRVTFSYSPVPTIQLCFATGPSYKKMLGTLAVDISDNIYVTSRVSREIDAIADLMRGRGRLLVSKELSL